MRIASFHSASDVARIMRRNCAPPRTSPSAAARSTYTLPLPRQITGPSGVRQLVRVSVERPGPLRYSASVTTRSSGVALPSSST